MEFVQMNESKSVTDARRYREIIERGGLSGTHKKAIEWVPPQSHVLELGCSTGYIGKLLMDQKGCRVTGVETDPLAAEEARESGLTVFEGSLEDPAFRDSLPGPFDVVMATDVLEHLANPEPVLLHMKRWLKKDGLAIIAVPNIATWSMRVQLMLRGDFEYQESGLLDRTHLHFFSYDTLMDLVQKQSWRVVDSMFDGYEIPAGNHLLWWWPDRLRGRLLAKKAELPLPARPLLWVGVGSIDLLNRARHRLGLSLVDRFPNLCAPHISLLLAPE